MAEREREYKLSTEDPAVLDRLAEAPEIAGFRLSPVETRDQEDVYLDTEDFGLFAAGYSLRYRRRSGTLKATVKEVPSAEGRSVLRDRREIEQVLGGDEELEDGELAGPLADLVNSIVSATELGPILTLRTKRRLRKLLEGGSEIADLCLDEVEVAGGGGGEAAARFLEVEVEEKGESASSVETVGKELLASESFTPSMLSKFERGLDFLGLLERARAADRRTS